MRAILILCLWGMLAAGLSAQEPREPREAVAAEAAGNHAAPLRFRVDLRSRFVGDIVSSTRDGEVQVRRSSYDPRLAEQPEMIEGYYLAVVTKNWGRHSLQGASLLRTHVEEVTSDGLRLRVRASAAEQAAAGGVMVLVRPLKATTAQLKAAPDFAMIAEENILGLKESEVAALSRSLNNLRQIGLAMHNYHDTYRRFPPGVIYGPDGKPWHSWRVLILPFLDQQALYDQYDFDEPWDGPNNRNLLEKIPSIYRDPIYGERMDHDTHYAAITGPGTGFPGGITLDDPKQAQRTRVLFTPRRNPRETTWMADFIDGTSHSVLVGSISPERKIPWTKPEDVAYTPDFPAPGGKGGFAAPYRSDKGAAGVFLRADGSAFTVLETAPVQEYRKLFTIGDSMVVGELPTLDLPNTNILVFEIQHTPAGVVAHVTREAPR